MIGTKYKMDTKPTKKTPSQEHNEEHIKHLSVSLVTDITFIQARQAISDEPKASQILSWRD